jgi:hypothetical protein
VGQLAIGEYNLPQTSPPNHIIRYILCASAYLSQSFSGMLTVKGTSNILVLDSAIKKKHDMLLFSLVSLFCTSPFRLSARLVSRHPLFQYGSFPFPFILYVFLIDAGQSSFCSWISGLFWTTRPGSLDPSEVRYTPLSSPLNNIRLTHAIHQNLDYFHLDYNRNFCNTR